MSWAAKPATAKISDADKRKAEYLYLEAIIRHTDNDNSSFYDLIKRAYELDPSNTIISYYYGYCILMMDSQTKERAEYGLSLMKRHYEAYPRDFYENYIMALVCRQLGRTDDAINVWETLVRDFPDRIQIYPLLADCYAEKGDFKKAIAAYDSIEKTEGRSSGTAVRKIGYMFALRDTAAAIKEGMELLHDAPGNLSYNTLMGDIFLQINNTDSAMAYYNKAQKIDPENGYINLSKANVYKQLGDSANYEKQITAAIVNKDIDTKSKIDIMTAYIRQCIQENDSSARIDNMFKVVIARHPHEPDILKLYCDYLTFKRDYPGAAEQLSYLLDLNPSDDKSWERLMWLYLYMKEPARAIETGKKALTYVPDDNTLYQIMGSAYYQEGDYDKSLEAYDTLLVRNKATHAINESDIYSGMAESYYKKGEQQKAFNAYERAIAISPNNYMVLNNYAYFLCLHSKDKANLEKAMEMSKTAVDANPDNVSFLDTYAWIAFLKQDYKTALEYMERAFSADGDDDPTAEMYEHYGDILFMNGRPADAVKEWEKALIMDPEGASEVLKKKVKNKTYFYE